MNILQIYPKADYFTGAAMQLRDLAAGLAARGHHVVVATRPSAQWERACAAARVRHAAVPMRGSLDLSSAWTLARLIREQHVEVVHCQKGRARSLALLAGLVTTIPVMILNRGVSFPVDRWTRLGYTTPRVSAIVAVCESIKRGLVASGIPAAKIDVIYSGTDLARFQGQVLRWRLQFIAVEIADDLRERGRLVRQVHQAKPRDRCVERPRLDVELQHLARARVLAAALQSLGIGSGQRVAVLSANATRAAAQMSVMLIEYQMPPNSQNTNSVSARITADAFCAYVASSAAGPRKAPAIELMPTTM